MGEPLEVDASALGHWEIRSRKLESSAGNKRFPDGFDSGPSALQCGCGCWCDCICCLSVGLSCAPKLGLCGLVLDIKPKLVLYS